MAPSTPIERVASTARWAAATSLSAVGSVVPALPAHANVAPQATSPSDAAAKKVKGTDGGGTALGRPVGRPRQEPSAGLVEERDCSSAMVIRGPQQADHGRCRRLERHGWIQFTQVNLWAERTFAELLTDRVP